MTAQHLRYILLIRVDCIRKRGLPTSGIAFFTQQLLNVGQIKKPFHAAIPQIIFVGIS